uniref:Butyrophilin subfamily 1 member A1-like n=1 Tax=Peromyscus maniculatus bairdii TaxID=230844 RepID=A0A8C8UPC9_PERMB
RCGFDPCLFSPLTGTSVSTEEFLVFGPSEPIVAAPGGEAILPCSLFPVMSVENMEELRWFRSRFSEAVFVYRDQEEKKEEQLAEYSGRTWLVKDQFHQGKAAVRIRNVQVSDSGIYVCFFKRGLFYEEAILELRVAVMGSVPEVHIKGPEDGGVCVVCMTSGWHPKPQVQWRDSRGERLPASSENHIEDDEGLFSMKTTLVVRDSSLGNVTCSTFNPILGQEKAMAMFIPEPFFPQASPWMPAFAVSVTMMGLLVLGSCCLFRREHSSKLQLRQEWENLRPWRKAQLYAGSVTLDPDSAHANLAISQDRMSVTKKDTDMHLDGPFSVLGTEGISSGRHYWEVKIKNGYSSKWTLGVWREDVEKQGWYSECPKRGFWTVGRTSSGYWAYIDSGRASLSLRQVPQSVGVFVDYSEGDISFYNMSDMSHIFSFHEASFSGTLFPYFRLESGDVSMILSSEEFPVPISILPSLKESLCSQREGLTLGSRVVDSLPEEESQFLPLPSDTLPP